jgi:integrase
MGRLSARTIQTQTDPGFYPDGDGLYLQVTKSAETGPVAKSWVFRFQLNGKRREMGLGSAKAVTLKEAREKAEAARKLVTAKIDPIEHKKTEADAESERAAAATTFKQAADAYLGTNSDDRGNLKHWKQWGSTLKTYAYPAFGNTAVCRIDTGLVLRAIEPIWRTKPETASRLRGRIETILNAAKVRGWRSGENPARWRGHLDQLLPPKSKIAKVRHHASMHHAELSSFWPRLQVSDGIGARALEFVILTAARSGEVRGATWDEIDMERALWTIPARRMKGGREHRVPLTDEAIALLKKMRAISTGALVFEGTRRDRPLSDMTLTAVLRRMKLEVTPHGFRSSFRSWAAERGYPDNLAEAALAHVAGDKVVQAYQRSDLLEQRRAMMQVWALFLGTKTSG